MSKDDIVKCTGDNSIRGVIAVRGSENYNRLFTCTSNTTLDFQNARNQSGTTANNYCIVTYVWGLK